jgi:AcrR family transcriptional regulator
MMPSALLPRHDPTTWRAQAAASQRDRLLVAMAESVAEHGYAATRVADVLARAGVSRRTFYEHFRALEDCFLATYDRGVEVLTGALAEANARPAGDRDWRELLDRLLATYLTVLASEPVFTQLALVEVLAAGPLARARYLKAVARFQALLASIDQLACRQDRRKRPAGEVALAALAGGLNRIVMVEVLEGRGRDLARLHDELLVLGITVIGGGSHTAGAGPARSTARRNR